MSDRTNATIRYIRAQWERIVRSALARAETIRQQTIVAGFRAFLDWSIERTQPARVRQQTIRAGFNVFRDWLDVRPKRIRARRNWDYFRAFAIPTVRHFLSYEKKGKYEWGGLWARNPLRAGNPVNHYTRFQAYMSASPIWDRFFRFLNLYHPYFKWGPRSRLIIRPGFRLSGPNNSLSGQRQVGRRQEAQWASMGLVTEIDEDEDVTEI